MKILYITRKYPPSIGGMQRMSYHLAEELGKKASLDKITWGYSQAFLPIFAMKILLNSILYIFIQHRQYDIIILCDAALSLFTPFFRKITQKPIVCITHGLDVTFPYKFYQKAVISSLDKTDMIICISQHTKDECIARGLSVSKIRVVPNGIDFPIVSNKEVSFFELKKKGIDISEGKKILLTVGRLVRRKGIVEFIERVFADLARKDPSIIYILIGKGKEQGRIEDSINKHHLENNVMLLGKVDDDTLRYAYAVSDVFIMPNIEVKGDIEGFGIVALEAAACGIPVIASKVDGITDAVKNNENGFLIQPDRPDIFLQKIAHLLQDDKTRFRMGENGLEFARQFSWNRIADRYLDAMKELI